MKSIIRHCCVFALFVCLCLTSGRVFSNGLSSNDDYSLLTKGSEEDRSLLKKLNELLEKANKDRDVVKSWLQDYVKQERKTYARVVNLFSKFEKSEQKQLAQDLKKGELSEKFRERLDVQNLLINFQRLEAERGYLEKIQGLHNRLAGKILEAESAREIIARRMISDVQEDKLREKEQVVDELSKFLDETRQKLDVWKENDRKQKENLIDSIVKDSKTQRQIKRSQDAQLESEEISVNPRGWKKVVAQKEDREQNSEVQDVEQEEDVEENSEEQEVSAEESSEEQENEREEVNEENVEESQDDAQEDVEKPSEELENEQEEVDEENAEESHNESEEVDLLEQKTNIDVDLAVKYAEEGGEEVEEKGVEKSAENLEIPQLDLEENNANEEIVEENKEEAQTDSKAVECNWTEVKQLDGQKVASQEVVRGVDLQQASKPLILSTKEVTDERQTISVGNVEFAFRLCSENGDQFWIQETETTQEQWFAVGIKTTRPCSFNGAKLPVENVDWSACVAYVNRLNALNVAPEGWIFTIPTDEQWERARNAGKGSVVSSDEYAWLGENSDKKTHEVGTKTPNALGLYDMSGNVWEWTRSTDSTGRALIVRGASWNNLPQNGVLSDRFVCAPKTCGNNLGLRLALVRKTEVAAPNSTKILR